MDEVEHEENHDPHDTNVTGNRTFSFDVDDCIETMDTVEHEENHEPHDTNVMEIRTFSYDVDVGIHYQSEGTAEIEQQPSFEKIPFEEEQETNQTETSVDPQTESSVDPVRSFLGQVTVERNADQSSDKDAVLDPVSSFLGQVTVERNTSQSTDIDTVFGFNFGNDVATTDVTDYHPFESDEGFPVDGFQCVNNVDESSRTNNLFSMDKNSDKSAKSISNNPFIIDRKSDDSAKSVSSNPFIIDRKSDDSAKYVSGNPFIVDRNSDESEKIVSSHHSDVDRNKDTSEMFVLFGHSDVDRNSDKPATCMSSKANLGEDNDLNVPGKDMSNQYEADDESEVVDYPQKPEHDHVQNSLNRINQFEDNGACGRSGPNETPVQEPSSTPEQTIRTRKQSVRFSDEVLVATFSNEEADSGENYVSSVGDGPFPPGPEDITTTTQGHRTERAPSDTTSSTSSSSGSQVDVPAAASSEKTIVRRKDSVGTNISPTDLLRRKQKQVTDKIIKSMHVFRKPSDEIKKPKITSHKLDYKDVPSRNKNSSDHDREKASDSRNEETVHITSLNPEQGIAPCVEKEQLKESKSVEHRAEEESPPEKHKTLLDRQNSRADLLIKQYSASKDSDDISGELESESADNDQTRKKYDIKLESFIKAKQELSEEEIKLKGKNKILVDPVSYSFTSPLKLQQKVNRKTHESDSESANKDQTRKCNISVDPVSYRRNMDRINEPEYDSVDKDQTKERSISVDPVSLRRKYKLAEKDQTSKGSISVDPVSYIRKYELAETDQVRKGSTSVDPVSYNINMDSINEPKYASADKDQTSKGSISVDPVRLRRKYELAETDETRKSSISVDPVSLSINMDSRSMDSINEPEYESADEDQTRKGSSSVDPVRPRRKYKLAETDQTRNDSISVDPVSHTFTSPSKPQQKVEDGEILGDGFQGAASVSSTSPSKLLRKSTKRKTNEGNGSGYGAFSYTSPSELLQKVDGREIFEESSPNVPSFSYTSPSLLLRKNIDSQTNEENGPIYGALSYTLPSELLFKTLVESKADFHRAYKESADDSENELDEEPGLWFFKRSNSSHHKGSTIETYTTEEQRKANSSKEERRNSGPESIRNQDVFIYDDLTDNQTNLNDVQAVLTNMNDLVSDFLDVMNEKKTLGEEVTLDDYQELCQFENNVETEINKWLKLLGYYENSSRFLQFKSKASKESIILARNLCAQMTHLTDSKHRMEVELHAKSVHNAKDKQNEEPQLKFFQGGNSSLHKDNFFETHTIEGQQKGITKRKEDVSTVHYFTEDGTDIDGVHAIEGQQKGITKRKEDVSTVHDFTEDGTDIDGVHAIEGQQKGITKRKEDMSAVHDFTEDGTDIDGVHAIEGQQKGITKRKEDVSTVHDFTEDGTDIDGVHAIEGQQKGITKRKEDVSTVHDFTEDGTNIDGVQAVLTGMNTLVTDFLRVIHEKKKRGEEVTPEDYRELIQFENTIEPTGNTWMKSTGSPEQGAQLENRVSKENVALAQNLRAQLTQLADAKHRIETEWNAKSAHTSEDTQNEESKSLEKGNSSKHQDSRFETNAINSDPDSSDDLSGDQTDINDVQAVLADMNSMLADFLGVLNDKRKRGEEVTLEDYQELCQFENTIETTVNSWLKYLGNFEQGTHLGKRASEENIALAQIPWVQLKQLADSKHGLEANLHARRSHNVGDKKNEEPGCSFSESCRNRHHEGNTIRTYLHHQDAATYDDVAENQSNINDVQAVLSNMNVLVSDFLAMMNDKRNRGEEVSPGDYRELCLLEDIIEATVNKWLKSLGYFEQVSHFGKGPSEESLMSEESIKFAQNIFAQLPHYADNEYELKTDSHARTTQIFENKQDTIANRGNSGKQQEIDQISWATDKGSNDTMSSNKNLYKLDSTETGYLADVSSHSINENKTFMNGWMFSNRFMGETDPVKTRKTDPAVPDSAAAPSSSASLDPDLWSTASLLGDDEAVRGIHSVDCDCFECKRKWFYWNERLERDPHAFTYESDYNSYLERPSSKSVQASRSAYARSRFKGTQHPSSFCLTSNPSFANSSDGEADMDDDVDKSGYEGREDAHSTPEFDIETLTSERGETGFAKRKQAGRSLTPDSKLMFDKEVVETQNRKLQMEISTLQTENKLLKEKYNRSQGRISELEDQLADAQDDVTSLQQSLKSDVTSLSARTQHEIDRGRDHLQARVVALTKENEALKAEVSTLEKQLESSNRTVDMVRHNTEKTRTLEAHKQEISSLKEELGRVKALLEQSERHLREEEERHSAQSTQVIKLTELKNALQQQQAAGSGGTVGDKQLKSLEKRLKVTEERLHQERADRANNLSAVEDKLLTENARLQAVEKDLTRQLNREKDKNRNLDQRVRQVRDENEKLRLAMPFDDAKLLDDKQSYDIPYSSHSNQRAELMKHISDDMNYILSQIEKQDGLSGGKSDHEEMIRTLWNKREMAYQQLRQYEISLQELHLNDNNVLDGLKNLRDTYGQAESKLHSMEEQVADAQTQMINLEATYKEQLNILVHERHDAFARLKTAEDILEAVRAENEVLRQSTHVVQPTGGGKLHNGGSTESLQMEISNLESKVAQLTRTNQRLEGELNTAKTQVDARNKTLQDVQSELELTYNRLKGQDGGDDRKQAKIDKLSSEVSGLQVENKMMTDKYNTALAEKSRLERELTELRKLTDVQKLRQQKTGHTEGKVQQQLKDSLAEKETRLSGLTRQLTETEGDLQKLQQDLYIEQMHNTELEAEVEQLRQTVDQRAQMFEALSGTEREQLAQYTMLKETLDTVNQELAQKHAQIISLDVNLSSQRDRAVELEAELERLRADRGDEDTQFTQEEQRSVQQLRTSELERERGQLKQELQQAYTAIKAAEEQYRTLQSESAQLEQELVKEKTVILQITAEKGEVEQHLEELAEEHDSLIQEKNQAEEDLIRLETKLQEILAKYETEARKTHSDFTKEYPDLPPEARKLVSELDSLRLLVDGKDREIGMLQDKINRQQIDIEFLNRKVELVHNDSISNREDVARMISELTLKMKEAVSTREVNQFLVAERTKLQNEKAHMELELEQERQNNDKRKKEIGEVLRKVQGTESRQKFAEQESKDKASVIASLETDLRSTQMNYSTVESEMAKLNSCLEQQNGDLRNLTQINATIEQQLEMEKTSLLEERSALSKLKEEFNRVSHDHELLQHEHSVLCDKHEADLQTIENLRKELSARQEETSTLQEELHATKLDLETQKGQLFITKDTVQKLTKDKDSIYQDYEGMCRTVTEKERQLSEIRERGEEKVDHLTQLHGQEKSQLIHDKLAAEQERDEFRRDHETMRVQLEQKEIQLNSFGKTLQELEAVTRQKKQLEGQLCLLESSSGDSKVLLEGQRKELMALNEALAKQQDRSTRIEAENHTLKAELKTQKEALNRECKELSITVKELKSQHENERSFLNDNLAKTQAQLRSVEASLVTASSERDTLQAQNFSWIQQKTQAQLRSVEASLVTASSERDTLQAQKRMTEKSLEDLKAQLTDEATGRRLAEQSVGTLRLQMEDMRNEKNTSEAHYVEMKSQLAKAEDQLKSEIAKKEKLSARIHELTATTNTSESTAKTKTEQVETLQKEVNRLKQVMEGQKQNMIGKLKKAQLEFKQQLDRVQEDRDKLVQQLQKISTDLEACREQLTLKNKDNLKLQEDSLVLQDTVKESRAKQKHAEEALREETDKLSSMASKFLEQDEELKRLRNFLAKKVEDSGDADKSMWQEMNRVIQDLSRQMQDHLDAQRSEGKDGGQGHHQVTLRYKKQLAEIQGELSTEKSLHAITRTSLSALEEDCQRLRHQLHAIRRREPTHSTEKKYKNRMEAINAIIARSQTQAQALLASGGYGLDPLTSPRLPNSARPGYGSPSHRPESPDNSYTEDLSIASLPPLHYGSSTQK